MDFLQKARHPTQKHIKYLRHPKHKVTFRFHMPRSRRRHHSRSRSRSHSHERDREPKRRRVDSPDGSHHRRSVSPEKSPDKIDIQQKEEKRKEDVVEVTSNKETNELVETESIQSKTDQNIEDNSKTDCVGEKEGSDINKSSIENEDDLEKSEIEDNQNGNDESHSDNDEKIGDDNQSSDTPDDNDKKDGFKTPRKTSNREQRETGSSKKKSKEEREKKRQEEKELREKMKKEKKEQKRKERQEKEEQRKKEKQEKEEQKRLEREEKEEQKRKEKEEKDEQKRKEREEKEEQKRKEREQKEIKKQQELEGKNKDKRKMEKEAAAFVNFFVPKKSIGSTEQKNSEEINSSFMPFAVKADMRLAPLCRRNISDDQKMNLINKMASQDEINLYLQEIKKGKSIGVSFGTWPVEDDDIILIEDIEIGECVEEEPKASKMRAKLLKFHENRRPAYFGTWRKKSKVIYPRKPLALDKNFFDYDIDSDDDWEEEEPGESLRGSDDEEKENEDDYEVDNEFFVPHGYLSDEEVENEENLTLTPETQKEKLKLLQLEFELEMKSKTERIKPRLIGCFWENKLKPKVQDVVSKFLEERLMIVAAPIIIKKRDLNTSIKQNSTTKTGTPNRKVLGKELVPDFLRMIHGNTNNRVFLVNEFMNYISNKDIESNASKLGLTSQLKQFAKWRRCPDEGIMFNKYCWYVNEDVRNHYNLNLILPNKWPHSTTDQGPKKKLSL